MLGSWAEMAERGQMRSGAVAFVLGEAVAGVLLVERDEEMVAVNLGKDAGSGDG